MSTLLKNLLIALAITALLILGYYFIPKNDDTDFESGFLDETPSAAYEIERILADTQRIDSIQIEAHDDVLSSKEFLSLVDRRIEIPDVATGRVNPFAPVQ